MKRILYLLILYIFLSTLCYSQEVLVPVNVQYTFMEKTLDYIKNFAQKSQLKIGIVYQSKNNYSLSIQEQLKKLVESNQQQSILKSVSLFDLSQENTLENHLKSLDIVYITPLRAFNIADISARCRQAGVLTIMSTPQNKEDGVVMGFDLENNKTKIVIDQQSAKQSNIEIKASLLKYARLLN